MSAFHPKADIPAGWFAKVYNRLFFCPERALKRGHAARNPHPPDRRAPSARLGAELFEMVLSGQVKIEIGQRFALRDAAEAHRALESRATSGSTVLTV